MSDLPISEIFAIKYAEAMRPAAERFLRSPDPHDGDAPIDYFIWLIRHPDGDILVDTGFGARAAAQRGRRLLRSPGQALAQLGVDPATIRTVVITHLHYDHAGCLDLFPNARFHIQEREAAGATGPDMCHALCRSAFDVENVCDFVRHLFADRICFVAGDTELVPGVTLCLLGGHTRGLQGVRVRTGRGWVMLGSDSLHFYANLADANPFPVLVDLPGVLAAGKRALALADSGDHLIPGHDPAVLRLFPAHPDVADVAIVSRAPHMPTPLAVMAPPRG